MSAMQNPVKYRTFEPEDPGSNCCRLCGEREIDHDLQAHCPRQPPACEHLPAEARVWALVEAVQRMRKRLRVVDWHTGVYEVSADALDPVIAALAPFKEVPDAD